MKSYRFIQNFKLNSIFWLKLRYFIKIRLILEDILIFYEKRHLFWEEILAGRNIMKLKKSGRFVPNRF